MTEHTADDGTARQDHWDDIVHLGWAPHFAAANVLKCLRWDKEPEHSLRSARWYYRRLRELLLFPAQYGIIARTAYERLHQILTPKERALLDEDICGVIPNDY